jgi:hypothetical protein
MLDCDWSSDVCSSDLNAFNLAFFQEKLWLHSGIDRADFADVERASDRWVARAMEKVALVREAGPAPS